MLIAFFNIRNSNHKHTCVEHIPNINFVFYPVKSDALTILQECPCCTRGNNFSSLQTLAIVHQFLKLRKYEYCAKAAKVMTELFLEDSEFLFLAISVISYQTRLLRVSQNRLQSLIYCDINISPACSVRGEL